MAFPLVPTQVQLWIRELRRLGRVVDERPVFAWLDEPVQGRTCLPVVHCSECGESGWIGLHDPGEDSKIQARGVDGIQLDADPRKIYNAWFGYKGQRSQHIVVITPLAKDEAAAANEPDVLTQPPAEGEAPKQKPFAFVEDYLCPASLVLRKDDGPCPLTGDNRRFRVKVDRETTKNKQDQVIGDQGCPNCGSKESVMFIGSQSATLSSVAIDEMFGSVLNADPKLLAFTDSVQDASHRAGFFTARTYHFTFRTALQHVIDDAGPEGVPLVESGQRLLDWWSQPGPGRPGQIKEVMASLMPPDLQQYEDFKHYRDNPAANQPTKRLREEIEERLTWEATSEFGVMQTHGRRMEPAGSSCLGWDEEVVAATIKALREHIPGEGNRLLELADLTDEQLRLWIYGFLYRYRLRGALEHAFLLPLAKQVHSTRCHFWPYRFGRRPKSIKDQRLVTPEAMPPVDIPLEELSEGNLHDLPEVERDLVDA